MLTDSMEQAMQGMIAMQAAQDTITNNLANADTPGYKPDTLMVSDFDLQFMAAMGKVIPAGFVPAAGGVTGGTHLLFKAETKFSQGHLQHTGQVLDLALDGNGFFTLETRDGIRFTRNGSFSLNGEGFLVTKDGSFVLGNRGKIQIHGKNFQVKPDGTILVDGKELDRLRISWIDTHRLEKVGGTDFRALAAIPFAPLQPPRVIQGSLEASLVNPIEQMVKMLAVMRAYEAENKILQTSDETVRMAIRVGKVG